MEYLQKLTDGTISRLKKKYPRTPVENLEDCVQDCLLKYLVTFKDLSEVTPQWLWTTCVHYMIDKSRCKESKNVIGCPEQEVTPDSLTLIDISADSDDPEVQALARQLAYPEEE